MQLGASPQNILKHPINTINLLGPSNECQNIYQLTENVFFYVAFTDTTQSNTSGLITW